MDSVLISLLASQSEHKSAFALAMTNFELLLVTSNICTSKHCIWTSIALDMSEPYSLGHSITISYMVLNTGKQFLLGEESRNHITQPFCEEFNKLWQEAVSSFGKAVNNLHQQIRGENNLHVQNVTSKR